MSRIIFHIDVNNAFLSWTAVYLLKKGYKKDIRKIPSVIGGDEKQRKGIVLAKSPVAKKYGIVTAETLYSARKKCGWIEIFPPNYPFYVEQSKKLYDYLASYTPNIEQYSIDECFLDMTGTSLLYGNNYVKLAYKIKNDIREKYGFTVNIGIGENKLCAKMASDFEKPDRVHTLYMNEIETKMWSLPVNDLFMLGRSSARRLEELGIRTIGDLAKCSPTFLKKHFKKQGDYFLEASRGIDYSPVVPKSDKNKCISISRTLPYDYTKKEELEKVLFDEVEKAHPEVLNLLLQILDDGRVTDSNGRCVDFKNTIIIMTSNVGSEHILEGKSELVTAELTHYFKPEFINRIDEVIVFNALDKDSISKILDKIIGEIEERLNNLHLKITLTDAARHNLVEDGFDVHFGARPLRRTVSRMIESKLANMIIKGEIKENDEIIVDFINNEFVLKKK